MINEQKPKIVRKIWGGEKLATMKGLSSPPGAEPIGETLEICQSSLPYLAKFIDTSDELSIQVHPGDEYARIHENSSGKTECWIILEAVALAGIYLGLKPGVNRETLVLALREKKPIQELVHFYPVKAGDFFFVPAGSIHAIGRDITLAEVQQNSGITYRVWDWDRLDEKGISRELHVEKSLDVINFDSTKNSLNYFQHKKDLFSLIGLNELCHHPEFHLFLVNQKKDELFEIDLKDQKRPCSILNLKGKIAVNDISLDSYGAVVINDEAVLKVKALEAGSFLLIR